MTSATLSAKPEYKVVGTRPIRHDGADKVTGKTIHGTDPNLPGMTWGKAPRGLHAHAYLELTQADANPDGKVTLGHACENPANEPDQPALDCKIA